MLDIALASYNGTSVDTLHVLGTQSFDSPL